MPTMTMSRIASVTATTKRAVATGQKRAAASAYLTGLTITPLQPVDPELRATLDLSTPHELLRTTINDAPDILAGDVLVVGSVEYPIRSVAEWPAVSSGAGAHLELIVEDLKR
jgi:hypothetical protein